MNMSLKDILNQVLGQSGFLQKETFANTADIDDVQMVAIANRVALEIQQFYPWSALRWLEFITVAETSPGSGIVQEEYPLGIDVGSIMSDSMYQDGGVRKVEFPTANSDWYALRFSNAGGGGVRYAQKHGNAIVLDKPALGDVIHYEYIRKYAVVKPDNTFKERFDADDDRWLLDDQVLILGIQAHWSQTKLMPQYEEWFRNYSSKMSEAIGRDAGAKTIGGVQGRENRSPYTHLYLGS